MSMKYIVNSFYYLKKDFGSAKANERVKIVHREKKGRKTYVSIETASLAIIHNVSVKSLRNRKR